MPPNARITALKILNQVEKKKQTLDQIVEYMLGDNCPLERRDRALSNALVYGVLRWQGRLDWIIDHFSKTPLKKIEPPVLNVLRLGLFQILYLTKIPVSAAVNTSVEMVKSFSPQWTVKYVNGVLRNASRNHTKVPFPDSRKDPVFSLSVRKSFPKWLVKRWVGRMGIKECEDMCDFLNSIPPITVRTNTLKTSRQELIQSLENNVLNPASTECSPEGVLFTNPNKSISEFQAFKDGWFQVQDEAAQIVSLLMNPEPGETVLDACAGLGGKTGHIAQLMKNQGKIIASDRDSRKLNQLESEMSRLGVSIVISETKGFMQQPDKKEFNRFDRILVDAPCSGLGVIRRNPDAKWSVTKNDLKKCQKKQLVLLENVAPLVKVGGCIVYTVCSMEPEENETVIQCFLANNKNYSHTGFDPEKLTDIKLPQESSILDKIGYFKTIPHIHKTDGFFSACLKRFE